MSVCDDDRLCKLQRTAAIPEPNLLSAGVSLGESSFVRSDQHYLVTANGTNSQFTLSWGSRSDWGYATIKYLSNGTPAEGFQKLCLFHGRRACCRLLLVQC